MSIKSELVYSFLTDKDYRRLCLSKFSYLQYWQHRHDAEKEQRDRVRAMKEAEIASEQLSVSLTRMDEQKKEAIGFGLFGLAIFVLAGITATLVAWLAST